jgi:TolB-like protein
MAQDAGAAAAPPGRPSLLLLTFSPIGDAPNSAWIGPAIQQNALAELSRMRAVQPLVPAGQPAVNPLDAEQALKSARAAGATFVVYGSFQLADPGIRVTGQLLEVRTGQFIGGIKATGALRDLFALEDMVSEQIRQVLKAQLPAETPAAVPAGPLVQAEGPLRAPLPWDRDKALIEEGRRPRIYDDDYEASAYRYTYGYPYYYSYYPYYGGWWYPRYSYYRPWYRPIGSYPGGWDRGHGHGGWGYGGWNGGSGHGGNGSSGGLGGGGHGMGGDSGHGSRM